MTAASEPAATGPRDAGTIGGPPVIDPTKLTTDAVNAAKDDFRRELSASSNLTGARLDAFDEATRLRLRQFEGLTPVIDREINHIRELFDCKVGALKELEELRINSQRELMDERAVAAKEALAAALQAAKELVTLAQDNTSKLLDQVGTLISTSNQTVVAQIGEVKERLDRGEGGESGRQDQRVEARADLSQSRQGSNLWVTVAAAALVAFGLLVSIAGVIVAVILSSHP